MDHARVTKIKVDTFAIVIIIIVEKLKYAVASVILVIKD
jgi:hypothetical protein